MTNTGTLCALLDGPSSVSDLQDATQRIGQFVQALRDAAANIHPLLSAEVDQVLSGEAAELHLAGTYNHDLAGIEAVRGLDAVAPAMPAGVRVYAFSPPVLKEMLRRLGALELSRHTVLLHQVWFTTELDFGHSRAAKAKRTGS